MAVMERGAKEDEDELSSIGSVSLIVFRVDSFKSLESLLIEATPLLCKTLANIGAFTRLAGIGKSPLLLLSSDLPMMAVFGRMSIMIRGMETAVRVLGLPRGMISIYWFECRLLLIVKGNKHNTITD